MESTDLKGNKIRSFTTGAVRNEDIGKFKMSLIPHEELIRVAQRYREGADAKGKNNWQLGIQLTELYDSAQRHLTSWFMGDKAEDHAAAAIWNIMGAMWMEKNKPEMDDR